VFNMTGSEIVVILLLALVVLGPEKLPDAIRKFGRAYAELKKMSSGFQTEFKTALEEPTREMRNTTDMLGSALNFGGAAPPQRPDTRATPEVSRVDSAQTQPSPSDPVSSPGESVIEEAASAAAGADEPASDPEPR
jgi:sec-independent protein translocase protein TatB